MNSLQQPERSYSTDEFMSVAIEAAKQAGLIMLQHFRAELAVTYKVNGEYREYPQPVSEVDRECDRLISQIIQGAFPNHQIITEETGWREAKHGYVWIIDALDGTQNYIRGIPLFCVSLGLMLNQDAVLGVVYVPYYNDLFCSIAGSGATLNGERIGVSRIATLEEAMVGSSAPRSYRLVRRENVFDALASRVGNLRVYAAPAVELCLVAQGVIDARVVAHAEPWDVFAGAMIAEEAGATVTDWGGNRWSVDTREMLIATPAIHQLLVDVLRPT